MSRSIVTRFDPLPPDPEMPSGGKDRTPWSEDAIARRFVREHGGDWRSLVAGKHWLRWDGARWRRDEKLQVLERIRATCRGAADAAAAAGKDGEARRLRSQKAMQAIERIASHDDLVAIAADELDAHPMLLNTPGGVVDLETGEVEPVRRDLLMTRIARAAPGGPGSRWRQFLEEITGGDGEMQAYLQRVAGYCLTGSTTEQAFFFLHGRGANGKSIFVNIVAAALGDYAKTAPFETFAATRFASHPTELAGLRGARLVLVTETERGRAWAESRIKAITGGDPIAARFMRGDFFEFRPMFKLIVAGNHPPELGGVGEAMRRRLQLVPFGHTIPEAKRDHGLQAALTEELGGVLAWMIDGCAAWRERGLDPPGRVRKATEEYFSDEDLVGQWLAERCVRGSDRRADSSALFASWRAFAEAGGHTIGSAKTLAAELRARGFEPVRSGRARGWIGIGVAGAKNSS